MMLHISHIYIQCGIYLYIAVKVYIYVRVYNIYIRMCHMCIKNLDLDAWRMYGEGSMRINVFICIS